MKVLITGAGGFLGRAVVKEALAAGHTVAALHRPAALPSGDGSQVQLEIIAGDLRQPGGWQARLNDIDAVVHCAAAASGDIATQLAGTVLATENLLAALPRRLTRFVHVSSFSVYDFSAPGWHGTLDENTPLEPDPLRRDAYTQTKLQQERMVRRHCATTGIPLVCARPGAIYGPGKDWGFGKAMSVGRFDLIFAPLSRMRLIHVQNCAAALVGALSAGGEPEFIVNLVDGEQPSHWAFHRAARKAGAPVGIAIPVPYAGVRLAGTAARIASKLFFGGRARLPEWLDLPRQEARWRPLRYGNARSSRLSGANAISLGLGLQEIASSSSAAIDT